MFNGRQAINPAALALATPGSMPGLASFNSHARSAWREQPSQAAQRLNLARPSDGAALAPQGPCRRADHTA